MSTFKCKWGAQKRKEKKKINETIPKQNFWVFTSEERNSCKFGSLINGENIVREEQQPSTSSQNQTETTTEPK